MTRALVRIATLAALAAGCGGGGGGGITETPANGTVAGHVSGPGGAVPGSAVALSGGGTQTTDGEGRFTFDRVAPGSRTLTLTPASGFVLAPGQTAEKSAAVAAGGTATVDWSVRLADPAPRAVEVEMRATSFDLRDVTVPVGSTVRWVNATAATHTVSPNTPTQAGAWRDQTVSGSGTVFEHTFATPGTYDYNCKLHAGMTGVVRVH